MSRKSGKLKEKYVLKFKVLGDDLYFLNKIKKSNKIYLYIHSFACFKKRCFCLFKRRR